ncbi:MAG: protein DA1, partial [Endozoicomonas sp. (ex Botrylloides leachii)]|nr:protein DA1 [Endozoicomonas sp. (ex Botrylloides leachii)]
RTVAIHELTHAWFFYNNYRSLPLEVEEGMCVLMEYIWLKNQKTMDAKYRQTVIVKSSDPIYGDGFRQARAALKLMPLKVLLRFLQEKNKFPTRLAAFFYH